MDYSPPGSSVHDIFQARILEWVAMFSSRGSSWPRDQTCVSYIFCIARCGKPNGTVWNRLKNKRGRFIEKTGENQTQTRYVIRCLYFSHNISVFGLPWWLSSKESACNAEDTGDKGFIPGSGRSPGGENGNPFQYSCLENPMDRGAWQATVYGIGHD